MNSQFVLISLTEMKKKLDKSDLKNQNHWSLNSMGKPKVTKFVYPSISAGMYFAPYLIVSPIFSQFKPLFLYYFITESDFGQCILNLDKIH